MDFWPDIEDEDAWKKLVEWRHPSVNLNLLQVALLEKYDGVWSVLWNEHFLREELYRDENGSLLNHPLHLYELLDIYPTFDTEEGRFPPVHHIRDALFYEEGVIDLTLSRLQGQSDMDTASSTTEPGQSGMPDPAPEDDQYHSKASQQEGGGGEEGEEENNLEVEENFQDQNFKEEKIVREEEKVREEDIGEVESDVEEEEEEVEDNMEDDEEGVVYDQHHSSATQREAHDVAHSQNVKPKTLNDIIDVGDEVKIPNRPEHMRLLPYRYKSITWDTSVRHLAQIIEKLCGDRAERSTADLLRSMIRYVADAGPDYDHVYYMNYVRSEDYFRDVFLLQCQMSFVYKPIEGVNEYFASGFCGMNRDYEAMMEGARFLPRRCVLGVLEAFESEPDIWDPDILTVLVLKDRLLNWNLQGLCMQKVMQMMGGDAQKVWALNLPVHIKEMFRVPFQKRYEELEKRDEEQRAEEEK